MGQDHLAGLVSNMGGGRSAHRSRMFGIQKMSGHITVLLLLIWGNNGDKYITTSVTISPPPRLIVMTSYCSKCYLYLDLFLDLELFVLFSSEKIIHKKDETIIFLKIIRLHTNPHDANV